MILDTMHTCIWDPEVASDASVAIPTDASCDHTVNIQEGTGHATCGRVIRDELFQYQRFGKRQRTKI